MGYGNPTGLSFMEHRILVALLEAGETYPLKLVNDSGGKLNARGIYTQLFRLEEKGFVRPKRYPSPGATRFPYRRTYYRVTETGKKALEAWRAAASAWSA